MADAKYLANRLKYHTAGRLASQVGESLTQALNVDGHTVTTKTVWSAPASAFPNNGNKDNVDPFDATNDLVEVFKTGYALTQDSVADATKTYYKLKADTREYVLQNSIPSGNLPAYTYYEQIAPAAVSAKFWNGGAVWTNDAWDAVKLYENVPMTKVKGSDGKGGLFQAYEVLASGKDGVSSGTIRLTDWVGPTAVADLTTGKPVAGFSGIPTFASSATDTNKTYLSKVDRWTGATWEFVYIAGLLTFEPDYTPENESENAQIALTAFKYTGKYLTDSLTTVQTDLADAVSGFQADIDKINSDIAAVEALGSAVIPLTGTVVEGVTTIAPVVVGDMEITGTISANGDVNLVVPTEVLTVKETQKNSTPEIIYPELSYVSGKTTLVADYGDTSSVPSSWQIMFKA
jgi:hypothetical protein